MAILGCLTENDDGRRPPGMLGRHHRRGNVHDGGEGCTARGRLHHQEHVPPPKGCLAVMVGEEGEEPQRFVVPLSHLSDPLFQPLLKRVEDVYGFEHGGPIAIPCRVAEFRSIQGTVKRNRRQRQYSPLSGAIAGCFGR